MSSAVEAANGREAAAGAAAAPAAAAAQGTLGGGAALRRLVHSVVFRPHIKQEPSETFDTAAEQVPQPPLPAAPQQAEDSGGEVALPPELPRVGGPAAAAAARAHTTSRRRAVTEKPAPPRSARRGVPAAADALAAGGRTPAAPGMPAGWQPPNVFQLACGKWRARVSLGGSKTPSVGHFGSQAEAAVARDVALAWRQLVQNKQGLGDAREVFSFTLDSLRRASGVLAQVKACSSWADVRALVRGWEAAGKLRQLAASLVPSPDATSRRRGGRKRTCEEEVEQEQEQQEQQEEEGQAAAGGLAVKAEPAEHQPPAAAAAARHRGHGEAAVGRRLRVWLQLDDAEVQEQHEGRVMEFTPTGKHHVLFDDGEQALLDLGQAEFRFLGPAGAAGAAGAAPAATAAAGAADVGQRLHVWWPRDRRWYRGTIQHVLRNGLCCVLYDDGMELLVDPLEDKVQFAWLPRQKQHERTLREHKRKAEEAAAAQRAAKRQQRMWEREERRVMQRVREAEAQQQRLQQQQQQEQQQQQQQQQRRRRQRRQAQPAAAPSTQQAAAGATAPSRRPPAAAAAAADARDATPAAPTPAVVEAAAAGGGGGAAQAAAAPAAQPAPDLFTTLLDATFLPAAATSGLTAELVASFVSLMDTLPAQERQAKEWRLRVLLAMPQAAGLRGAAVLMQTSLDLALARVAGRSPAAGG